MTNTLFLEKIKEINMPIKNLWILTEERPKSEVLIKIIEKFIKDNNTLYVVKSEVGYNLKHTLHQQSIKFRGKALSEYRRFQTQDDLNDYIAQIYRKLTRDNIGIYKNKNSETQVKINLLERVFNFVFGISLILKVFSKIINCFSYFFFFLNVFIINRKNKPIKVANLRGFVGKFTTRFDHNFNNFKKFIFMRK
jgi:hypothetical protein